MNNHQSDTGDDRKILNALRDKSGIIDKKTAGLIVERMREVLGPAVLSMSENFGINAAQTVRSRPLFHTCRAAREKKGLTVKDAAALLDVPQYQIKAIEGEESHSSIKVDILERYINFLGLGAFYERWGKTNKDIYARWKDGG